MQQQEIADLLHTHFGSSAGYDPKNAQQLAGTIASAVGSVSQASGATPNAHPSSGQQQCYAKCAQERDIELAAAAKLGYPAGTIAAAAAIMKFNACRHACDQHP